jgi:hypothetical protein
VPEPADLRRRAVAAAYADGTEEGKLRHRYEMAIDRSLRATIQQLIMLEKSGADLGGDEEVSRAGAGGPTAVTQSETEVDDRKYITSINQPAPREAEPAAPGSLGAGEAGSVRTPVAAPMRRPEAPDRADPAAGKGRSSR